MKSRYLLLSLTLILTLLLSGCSNAANPSSAPSNHTSDNPSAVPSTGTVLSESNTFRGFVAVPLDSDQDWQESLSVAAGTSVVLQIEYANFQTENLLEAGLVINLPSGVTVVPDSTFLWNASYADGVSYDDSDGIAITTVGINLGDYTGVTDKTEAGHPGSNAYIRCTIEIADNVEPGTELVISANAVATGADTGTVYVTTGDFTITII